MASDSSFDIVSEVDLNAMNDAIMQAQREIANRYDFRGSSAAIAEFDRKEKLVTVTADNEPQMEAVVQVLVSKMIKRGVDARVIDRQKMEAATHNTFRQKIKLKSGIDKENAKLIQAQVKGLGLKVNANIQGDALRVSGSKKDDLQAVMAALRAKPPAVPIQFDNFK
jgi:uncharacterized protein YajQ (UPF0234 family)